MAKKKPPATTTETDRDAKIALLKLKYPNLVAVRKPVAAVHHSECLKSPSISINLLTNEGGFRAGATIEWYGLEGTLKSWYALEMCREAQLYQPDKSVAYFDPEHAVDKHIAASKIGVDMGYHADGMPKFDYVPEDGEDEPTLEEYLNRIYDYAASGLYSFIVLDSVAACMSTWESEQNSVTDAKWGGPSIPMSKAMKRIKAVAAKTGCRILYINQLRTTTVSTPQGPKSKDEPGGGKAIRYAATHRYKVSWANKNITGHAFLRITADKNKYGPPWQTVEIPIILGHGIDAEADLVVKAAELGVIHKSGSYFYYGEQQIGQGLMNAANLLRLNQELFKEIYDATLQAGLPKEALDTPLIDQNDEAEIVE